MAGEGGQTPGQQQGCQRYQQCCRGDAIQPERQQQGHSQQQETWQALACHAE